ncbi:Hypothetical predicted protein [Pelobates cultripes]|uniref:Uncharacterized protein n=1 Tax=Pelobates cultripes TaxID=61616 RepID=A0AAD1TCX0_PELCU|nr:Hypothetical predicted protein [Pelobates cultripes]
MQLRVLQDLCRSTLAWRQSLQQVTQTLRSAKIGYKWGPSCTLLASKDECSYQLSSAVNSAMLLRKVGLISATDPEARPSCSWDISKAVPFIPRVVADTG